ncbi:DUF485 domain-containing protein [Streptomyces roseicoloratus]|uniref:DUF485 domain-containing protein n=1 Tax=Streptomyces roseicoloratus TaxID=2508722 RepID=A0ABY9RRV5_9ACTN|nr:DUF485 domain-containing protein [Streptomyces roseicoloratus]WMX44687.1 DUF485 domain-containing protein [Streptomyces roseicoloratus]
MRPKRFADKESSPVEKQEGRDPATVRFDDPWYDELAAGWGEHDQADAPAEAAPGSVPRQQAAPSAADIYLEVQRSPAFQEVRGRYRRFVFPAALAFLLWYLAYVVAATAVPGLMARPVAGAVNVAMVAGLGQFATTFLLTWAYARHARLRRDRAALELRWDTQEMTRGARQ